MDRPSGPLGSATQSSAARGTSDTSPQPVTMRRPVGTPPAPAAATLAGPVPPVPPIPDLRTVASSTALSSAAASAAAAATSTTLAPPTSPARVVALFTDAIQNALQENEVQAQRAEGGTTGSDLKAGVTIDLSREGIRELPEEVVDVIKHELERSGTPLLMSLPAGLFPRHTPPFTDVLASTGSPYPTTIFQPFQPGSPSAPLYGI